MKELDKLSKKGELEKMLNLERRISKRGEKIQRKYTFEIPDYVLHEIVEKEERNNNDNIITLINLAIINNKISLENSKVLKKDIKTREVYSYLYSENKKNIKDSLLMN